MVHGDRTERITLRLTPEESAVVAELAEESGLSISDVVRQAVRVAYADRFKKPKK
jgi:uncharacterized protein (DUF1778 family)